MAETTSHLPLPLGQEKCKVCAIIASKLRGKLMDVVETLGTFDEVMASTKCQLHPRMFREYFRLDVDNNHVESFYASYGGSDHGLLYVTGVTTGPIPKIFAMGLYPFGLPRKDDYLVPSRVLDPEWIDHDHFHRWKIGCDNQKFEGCQVGPLGSHLPCYRPHWLIDTWRMCLTSGDVQAPYVALSYVWGTTPFFKTLTKDLAQLQIDFALSDENFGVGIPKTIKDTIAVVGLLKERYLWVDALCIVQDGEEHLDQHINNMAAIFAYASITIVAARGKDAHSGLHGLRGISRPRKSRQEMFRLEGGLNVVQRQRFTPVNTKLFPHKSRGWTFQENLFARRKLIFWGETVQWRCACSRIDEDCEPCYGSEIGCANRDDHNALTPLTLAYPLLEFYINLVGEYNDRVFTYPENAFAAFAGTLSVLGRTYRGGIVCGLPVMFFDAALCWVSNGSTERRLPSSISNLDRLPSWSWVSLKCGVFHMSWEAAYDYIKKSSHTRTHDTGHQVIPIVQWYTRTWNDTQPRLLQETQMVFDYRTRYFNRDDESPPVGWSRVPFQKGPYIESRQPITHRGVIPRHFYKHESDSEAEFWYPIPLCDDNPGSNNMLDTLLSCRTQRVRLTMSERISAKSVAFSIRDGDGVWIGTLQQDHGCPADLGQPCELVSISRGYRFESCHGYGFAEWNLEERPKGSESYEFYNVLWVEWVDGIAFRKGLGRIVRSAWEAQDLEWIDLTLG